MSLKVFLVEDEYVIRQAIKSTVDWNAAGFELVGEAGDGERAYQMILGTHPDILITDIRMPFMDGLELSRLVRKKLPATKIIILSGYDDFSYAREAISMGVTEYLLKPVSGAKLLETLRNVANCIEAERQQQSYKDIYEAEHEERLRLEKQKFLRELIGGRLPMAEALEAGQVAGIRLDGERYAVVLIQLAPREEKRDAEEDAATATASIVDLAEQKEWIGTYEQIGGVLCMLFTAHSAEELERYIKDEVYQARTIAAGYEGLLFFASIGAPALRISEIHTSWSDANRRFAKRFLCDGSRIFHYSDDEDAHAGSENKKKKMETFSLTEFDIGKIDRRLVSGFLRSGTEEDVPAFVEECFSSMGSQNLDSQLLRHYVVMDTYLTTASFLTQEGFTPDEIEESIGALINPQEIGNASEAAQYFEKLFLNAVRERDRKEEDVHGSMVAEARQYIHRHFDESDMSLSGAAEVIGVSPNHLSRIFSQKTGNTFIEYLTEVRMDKAKDLLLATDLPAAEIGMKVGYSDPHYFYYSFKKSQGMTPKEFRQSQNQSGR